MDGKQVYGDSIFLSNENSFLSLKESMCGVMVTKRHFKLIILITFSCYLNKHSWISITLQFCKCLSGFGNLCFYWSIF